MPAFKGAKGDATRAGGDRTLGFIGAAWFSNAAGERRYEIVELAGNDGWGFYQMTNLAGKGTAALTLVLAAAASGSACAMSPTSSQQLRCVVQGEEKLPPELGGADAVCSAIERASAPVLQRSGANPSVSVNVQVLSAFAASAVVTVGAERLPEQRVDISDRPLNARTIDMLARAVAAQLSKATQE